MLGLATLIVIVLFGATGLGLYLAAKNQWGKVGTALSTALGSAGGYVLEATTGYGWVVSLALAGNLPAILFLIGHITLLGVLLYNTYRYKKAIM